jgi:hypothetical protein
MRRIRHMRRSIIAFKLVFGIAEIWVGVAWFVMPGGRVGHAATSIISILPGYPRVVAAILVLLGLVKVGGAVGLISGTAWGWRIMTASVAILVPYDARAALPFAPVDLLILGLLWHYREHLGGGRRADTMRPDAGPRQEARRAGTVARGRP